MPPSDWTLPRSWVTSCRQRGRWPSSSEPLVARLARSRFSPKRGSPGSNIARSVSPLSDRSAIWPGRLKLVRVRAFAIIEELEVHFAPGFNVLTGETGAGKSILVEALHLVLGGRAQADSVRTGAEEAEVQALFRPRDPGECDARLQRLGLPAAGTELVVRRSVQREGRSRAWVNGALATAAQLQAATRALLDISGQHEHVGLLDAALHLDLLDSHAQLAGLRPSWTRRRASCRATRPALVAIRSGSKRSTSGSNCFAAWSASTAGRSRPRCSAAKRCARSWSRSRTMTRSWPGAKPKCSGWPASRGPRRRGCRRSAGRQRARSAKPSPRSYRRSG